MISVSVVSLGVFFLLLGLILAGVTWYLARLLRAAPPAPPRPSRAPIPLAQPQHGDGMISLGSGGRVLEINAQARQWFNLGSETPNLEALARLALPSNAFMGVCAGEGQARLTVNGMVVEAVSYALAGGGAETMLVTLRRVQIGVGDEEAGALSGQTLRIFAELSQAMAASLDPDRTIRAILTSVQRLLPADLYEITVWEAAAKRLIPFRLVGFAGAELQVARSPEVYRPDNSYSGYLCTQRQPLLIGDVSAFTQARPSIDRQRFPFLSYLGLPLVVGDELVGTLELASLGRDSFTPRDLEILKILADQAAVALHNALAFQAEQGRAQELAGLARLAQAISITGDRHDLVARLVDNLVGLLKVEVVGFLIYNEARRMLAAQAPWAGIPPGAIEWVVLPLAPDSPAEAVWGLPQVLVSDDPAEDSLICDLGLQPLARTAGLRQLALAPISSGTQRLGYLLSANKRDDTSFSPRDVRLLTVAAGQSAALIENSLLLEEGRRRVQRAETLRRITNLTSSQATLDEILKYALLDLVRLLGADRAGIWLEDKARGELRLHTASAYNFSSEAAAQIEQLAPNLAAAHSRSIPDTADPEALPSDFRPLAEALAVGSLVLAPLIVQDQVIGSLLLASHKNHYFLPADQLLSETVAGQMAAAWARVTLASQTDPALRQNLAQLSAVNRLSRELNGVTSLNNLLELVYPELARLTGATCGSVRLFEPPDGRDHWLQAGPDPVASLTPLERAVVTSGQTRLMVFESETPPHTGVQAALLQPILASGEVVGLIHLHRDAAGDFASAAAEAAAALGLQIGAVSARIRRTAQQAAQNDRLARRVTTLTHVSASAARLSADLLRPDALMPLAQTIAAAAHFTQVRIYTLDGERLRLAAATGLSLAAALALPPPEVTALQSHHPAAAATWDLALQSPQGAPLGLIRLDQPQADADPEASWEAVTTLGAQAALLIAAQREIASWRDQAEAQTQALAAAQEAAAPLQAEVSAHQTAQAARNAQTNRSRAGLTVAEALNRQANRQDLLQTLAEALCAHLDVSAALVVEPIAHEGGDLAPRLVAAAGSLPERLPLASTLGQRNPLRQVLQSGAAIITGTANSSHTSGLAASMAAWQGSPLLNSLAAAHFACLPLFDAASLDAALLVVRPTAAPAWSAEDVQLLDLLARQTGIALQNLHLLEDARRRLHEVNLLLDFSRKLGSLEPADILDALVESALTALPNAQTALVALWDERQGRLIPQASLGFANPARLNEMALSAGEGLIGQVFEDGQRRLIDELDFARQNPLAPENLLSYRDAAAGHLPVSSLVIPITSPTRHQPLGVLSLENSQLPAAFTPAAADLVTSLVQQTALLLENARLYIAAQERAGQLQALTQAAATITSNLEPSVLIGHLLEQLQQVLPYDTGILWLRQEQRRGMTVQAARGYEDNEQRLGISISLEDSPLLGEMIGTGEPLSVGDVTQDARFPAIMAYERLSWLGVPLLASGEVMGVIALEKTEPNFYTTENIQIATTFAGQAAVALQNAELYQQSLRRAQELAERSQRLAMLNRLSSELAATPNVAAILKFSLEQLYDVVECTAVSAILFGAQDAPLLVAEHPDGGVQLPQELASAPLFEHLRQSRGLFISDAPLDEPDLAPLRPFLLERSTRKLLVLPLAAGAELHGLLLVHAGWSQNYSPSEMELARTISNQVAIAIENARLFAETHRLTTDLERRVVARTEELAREHQRAEILLRMTTELSASLDLEQVLQRTLRVLNEMVDARQITLLVARPGAKDLQLLASLGEGVSTGAPEMALARQVIAQRQTVSLPTAPSPAGAVLAVPLMLGADALGALLLFHPHPDHFAPATVELVQAAANQIAVALNNAELYRLIRDQAEDLGGMLRRQQVETSRSQAILEAVADGVLVTNAQQTITLFNEAAERILGLPRRQVVGKPLEQFTGLFGHAASAWREVIQSWSGSAAASPAAAETYEEQITLENGRVVAIRLAPVRLRRDFLGTVSIFQDITHQVEVDRLKSEFVATVSHELRTPMTSIKGYVEIMLMGAAGPISEQQSRFLQVVKTNTERLTVLVNDLLDVSRIEAGSSVLTTQSLRLDDIVAAALLDLEQRAQDDGRSIRLRVDLPADLPRLQGDPERIRQILDNLLDNAYLYNAPDGEISLQARPVADFVQIDIHDSGMGIPKAEQARVFERFFRGESPLVLGVGGTGLGLSIVQNLVHMHGGRIWLISSGLPGEGSTFSFTLPLAEREISAESPSG